MINRIKKVLSREMTKRLHLHSEIEIDLCAQCSGWKYGDSLFNPFQAYIEKFAHGEIESARTEYRSFLENYRPRNMAEALGVDIDKKIPLWDYPWNASDRGNIMDNGRVQSMEDVKCDIMTHFYENRIPEELVEIEYKRMENAYTSLNQEGYMPEKFKNYAELICLQKLNGDKAYIVSDGNHRMAALHVLGYKTMQCIVMYTIRERDINQWIQVKRGIVARDDARKIMYRYFEGNAVVSPNSETARIV